MPSTQARKLKRSPEEANVNTSETPHASDHKWSLLLAVVGGLLLVYVWRIQEVIPLLATLQIPTVLALAGLGLLLSNRPALRRLSRFKQHPAVWTLVILALGMVSIPFSVYPGHSFEFIFGGYVKLLILVALILTAVRGRRDIDRLLLVHVAGGVLFTASSLWHDVRGATGRLGGLAFYDPNDLALVMLTVIPIILYLLVCRRYRFMRLIALPLLLFFLFVFIQTGSRGGFLALVAMGLYLVLLFNAVPRWARVTAIIGGIAVFSMGASDEYWEQMGTLLNPQDDYNWAGESESGRMEIWQRGLGYIAERPLTGVGARAFHIAEGRLSDLARERAQYGLGVRWAAAHNSYIEMGAELGIFGFIAFSAMLFGSIWKAHSMRRHRRDPDYRALGQALAASLIAFAVAGFFLSQAWLPPVYAYVALVAVFLALEREEVAAAAVASRRGQRGTPARRVAGAESMAYGRRSVDTEAWRARR